MKADSLKALAALRAELKRRADEAREAAARAAAAEAEAERRRALFATSVGPVQALSARDRAELERERPPPLPRQREADEQAALRASLSDDVDIETLLLTDDGLSFRRPGVGPDVVGRRGRGQWSIQAESARRPARRTEARERVAAFVRGAQRRGQRCVRIVHGKGHGSPGRQPVLKAKVQRWLAQCDDVIAFTQASGPQGGAGALIVLLG